jgi:hypothetical protein
MSKLHIGVFGDSYADRVLDPITAQFKIDESWMAYINSKGHKVSSYGLAGSASWHAVQSFKRYYRQFDHIVFCWSYAHRIQNMPFKYATLSTLKDVEQFYTTGRFRDFDADEQSQIVQIVLGYQHSCDFEFNFWVQQKMFDEVNQICKENNIKLVNILPFVNRLDSEITFKNRAGDCLFRLFEVTSKELDTGPFCDTRSTHLSKENNEILGQIILDRFEEGQNIVMDLLKQGNFKFSDEIRNRYIDYGHKWSQISGINNGL